MKIEPHYARDRRYYWGAACDDLQREWDTKKRAREQLAEYGARATYYPAGSFYVGFVGNEIATDDCPDFWSCYDALCELLGVE